MGAATSPPAGAPAAGAGLAAGSGAAGSTGAGTWLGPVEGTAGLALAGTVELAAAVEFATPSTVLLLHPERAITEITAMKVLNIVGLGYTE